MMTDLTFEIVNELLSHDPKAGKLFWRERDKKWFDSEKRCAYWNSRYAGKEAFTAFNTFGYKRGAIFNKYYMAHRVIWLLETGCWPREELDHINGIRDDNRIENLRAVSPKENRKNHRRRSDNASGITGVHWDKSRGKWLAHLVIDGRFRNIGRFDSRDDAIAARKQAERKHGFHENHGRA